MPQVAPSRSAATDARRWARVGFSADVELLTGDPSASPQTVLPAQAVDLGAGGMRLSVHERVPVGADVTCRVWLDGRSAELPARVVWLRANTAPTPHGMGVRFGTLGNYERELLAHVVERTNAGYRPVELRFDALDTPLIARASEHGGGLRVSAPLAILNRGAGVVIRFEGEVRGLLGTVTEARVTELDGTRCLEVDVALPEAPNPRFRRAARYGYADEIDGEPAPARSAAGTDPAPKLAPAATEAPAAEPELTLPPSRARKRLRLALTLCVAAACGAAVSAWLERSASDAAAKPAPSIAPAFRGAASLTTQAEPAAALPELLPDPAQPAMAEMANEPSEAKAPAQQETAPRAAPAPPRKPEAKVEGAITKVFLPFEGSLEGMETRTWVDPPALAIDLPQGSTALESGFHPARGGSADGLRISRRGDVLLVRVLLAAPISRFAIAAQEHGLEVNLVAP